MERCKDFMNEQNINSKIKHKAAESRCNKFKTIKCLVLGLLTTMALQTNVDACTTNSSFDVTRVSDVDCWELYESAPEWCSPETCRLIIDLSNFYGISSEFALSVFRYEYVPERNSVGGVKGADGYITYDCLERSIIEWFQLMAETYCNEDSWVYNYTQGTTIHDIAPMYNQGVPEFNDSSARWCETIEQEVQSLLDRQNEQDNTEYFCAG